MKIDCFRDQCDASLPAPCPDKEMAGGLKESKLKWFWVLLRTMYKKTVVSESITFCRVMMISESVPKLNATGTCQGSRKSRVVAWATARKSSRANTPTLSGSKEVNMYPDMLLIIRYPSSRF